MNNNNNDDDYESSGDESIDSGVFIDSKISEKNKDKDNIKERFSELSEIISSGESKWLPYPTTRGWHKHFSKLIINKSVRKDQFEYMGAYMLTSKKLNNRVPKKFESIKKFDRERNLDIIYEKDRQNRQYGKKPYNELQDKFLDLQQFAENRQPPNDKIGVYFFGDFLNAAGLIHWNVAFVGSHSINNNSINKSYWEGVIRFFDPDLSIDDLPEDKSCGETKAAYDFKKRIKIRNAFDNLYNSSTNNSSTNNNNNKYYKCSICLPKERPQQFCKTDARGLDKFCQTWCLMFLDVVVNNSEENFNVLKFYNLDFKEYQKCIVKDWLIFTLKKYNFWDTFQLFEEKDDPEEIKKGLRLYEEIDLEKQKAIGIKSCPYHLKGIKGSLSDLLDDFLPEDLKNKSRQILENKMGGICNCCNS